ncbi:MAG: hypothetical protein H0W99_00785 [Acidobacteria bacterium]|nr:hypothetical protein [Acidobacteriota bacterium]
MSAHREHPFGGTIIRMSGQRLAIREQQLQETEEQFQEVARQWLTKERQIQELAALVQIREQELQARDQQLQDKDRQLQSKDQQLQVRDQQLEEKEQLVQAKEQLLSTTEQLIATKNQLLTTRERQLAEQESKLQANDQQLHDKDQELQAKDQKLQEISQRLSVRQQHLDEVLGSRALRIGSTLTWPVRKLRHGRFRSAPAALDPQEVPAVSTPVHEIAEEITEADAPAKPAPRNVGTLAIGVVTFNNSQAQLAQLARSIELAVRHVDEAQVKINLFVIDNGRKSGWPQSVIPSRRIETQGNIGFGRGMNSLMTAAFAESETEWFLCVNPDGVMHRRALKELLSSSRTHPDSLIEARQFPEEHVKPYDPQTLETPWASGACLLIRRRIFESIGGFDTNFFMYLEDIDLSWRARSAGFSIRVSPNALFGHAVLHRKPDPGVDKSFLLSGRYLAFKWKHAEFFKWAERELVKRKYYQSRSELPALDGLNAISTGINPELADFNHYFNFSTPRW